MHGAVEIARLSQIAGSAEQHRRVSVMAAGVHPALMRRAVRETVGFEDRQAIHIGPQPDRARRVADAQPADHPGLADAAMHLDAPLRELVGDQLRGAPFLETELGMGVDVAPPPAQLVVFGVNQVDDGHIDGVLPAARGNVGDNCELYYIPGASRTMPGKHRYRIPAGLATRTGCQASRPSPTATARPRRRARPTTQECCSATSWR